MAGKYQTEYLNIFLDCWPEGGLFAERAHGSDEMGLVSYSYWNIDYESQLISNYIESIYGMNAYHITYKSKTKMSHEIYANL